jgi:hypothetical protein
MNLYVIVKDKNIIGMYIDIERAMKSISYSREYSIYRIEMEEWFKADKEV